MYEKTRKIDKQLPKNGVRAYCAAIDIHNGWPPLNGKARIAGISGRVGTGKISRTGDCIRNAQGDSRDSIWNDRSGAT